jgi:diguanylate cyclase (GGDEF)-like protein
LADHRGSGLAERRAAIESRGFAVEISASLRATLERLTSRAPTLVVLDPLVDGGEVELGAVDRARRGEPPPPLIVFVERDDAAALLRTHRLIAGGPWDLAFRGASDDDLALTLERLARQRELALEMGELRHRAYHDDKTELLRPHAFQARLEEHFSAAKRHYESLKQELALVLIDLDDFGSVNKRHDHTVGDALIALVGDVIKRSLRTEDVAGRLGGDEFAVLLPYTRKVDAAVVVNRLRERIAKLSERALSQKGPIRVSASLGFETFDGRDVETVEELRAHSERALRTAKEQGGDRGIYYRGREALAEPNGPEA